MFGRQESEGLAAGEKRLPGYEAVRTLADGVTILAPKSKPTHFTTREIRAAIEKLRKNGVLGAAPSAAIERG